jgi:Tfp pilus assembly protein PilO
MQQHRIISLLSILVMLIIPAIGWVLVAQPQLSAAATADAQRAEAAAQVAVSQSVVAQLKVDSAKLPELKGELNELRTTVPAGIDPEGYIDGLSALAQVAQVQITTLTVDDAVAYSPATPPAGSVPPPATEGDEGADPATGSDEPAAPVAYPGIVTNPLIDSSNFVAIPVTIEVTGKSASILRFVNGLQTNDRLFLVTTLTTEQTTDASVLTGKIGGFIWAMPAGIVGEPRPVSTIVKSMEPADDADAGDAEGETETPDPGSTDAPDPDPTETPAP